MVIAFTLARQPLVILVTSPDRKAYILGADSAHIIMWARQKIHKAFALFYRGYPIKRRVNLTVRH